MVSIAGMFQHYRQAFDDHQAKVLAEATVQIEADLVLREDFSELTATVGRLADTQERTEERMNRLSDAQERTEEQMKHLVAAKQRTPVPDALDSLESLLPRPSVRLLTPGDHSLHCNDAVAADPGQDASLNKYHLLDII